MEGFAQAIGEAFESLATIRLAIDQFLAELPKPVPLVAPVGRALILDLEGLDETVEVGLILVAYNSHTDDLAGTLDSYTGLRDAGVAAKLPGKFSRKMVAGKKIDKAKIEELIAQADVIISHNNGFDRPRFEKLFPSSRRRHWLCSLNGLPWLNFGFQETGFEYLCERHGIRNSDWHRALPDAQALLELLAQKRGSISYFSELLRAGRPQRVKATAAGKH
jgi:hypothetical protein